MLSIKNGFTLAETMITMIVLGIVASLTIPTVINNNKRNEFIAGYHRAINVLNNAYGEYSETRKAQYETKYREVKTCPEGTSLVNLWSIEFCLGFDGGLRIDPIISQEPYLQKSTKELDPTYIGGELLNSTDLLVGNLIQPYISLIKTGLDEGAPAMAGCSASSTYFYTADGMRYCIEYSKSDAINADYNETTYGIIWVDVNGDKGPNQTSANAERPGDTFPIIMMKQRFIPGHPTNSEISTIAQNIYFGKKNETSSSGGESSGESGESSGESGESSGESGENSGESSSETGSGN